MTNSDDLYGIQSWGAGYFTATERGTLAIHPDHDPARSIDLHELIQGLDERGVQTPVLLRFSDIVRHRLTQIRSAFDKAIETEDYKAPYRCVYPIKVNQQASVLEEIRDIGGTLDFGLEAGSKPELLAVLGMTANHPNMPIVCNGFKDREFLETVILATKLGRRIIPIVEKFSELIETVELAKRYAIRPSIGIRVKVSAPGVGRWEASGGDRSKFGLSVVETLEGLKYLEKEGMADCLNLLHCHLGSQICDIRNIKNGVSELTHIYCELKRLGAGLTTLDIGGGMGVDYDGSRSSTESSVNYSVAEYAADVVYRVKSVCDAAGIEHPEILSESGRAMVAYSSVLVFDVIGTSRYDSMQQPDELELAMAASRSSEKKVPQPVIDLYSSFERLKNNPKVNIVEVYHDVIQAHSEVRSLFGLGYVGLPLRAIAERVYLAALNEIMHRARTLQANGDAIPDEIAYLEDQLSDHYFCNLSIFQSVPDSWAIEQIFPICPIHRLNEVPTRRGVLADITCDSDGMINRFIDPTGEEPGGKRTLELHEPREGETYYLAIGLVGAYQEILGDLHNLLGDTHAVHVSLEDDADGGVHVAIDEIIPGDSVRKVLSYVQINADDLRRSLRRESERAVRSGKMTAHEAGSLIRFYEEGLEGYTYFED